MTRTISRRFAAAALAAVVLSGAALAQAQRPSLPTDMSLGKADAPVTLVEYASVGCPHCAAWHREVWPAFKAKYVDTGQVRFVYREMLTGNPALAYAGFITARCVPRARYFDVVEDIAQNYDAYAQSIDLKGEMKALAGKLGLSAANFETCYKDEAKAGIVSRHRANVAVDQVQGTPTLVVNGVKVPSPETLETLDRAIAAARP